LSLMKTNKFEAENISSDIRSPFSNRPEKVRQ